MIRADLGLRPADLEPGLGRLWQLSAGKILDLDNSWSAADGSPHGLLIFFCRTFSSPGRS